MRRSDLLLFVFARCSEVTSNGFSPSNEIVGPFRPGRALKSLFSGSICTHGLAAPVVTLSPSTWVEMGEHLGDHFLVASDFVVVILQISGSPLDGVYLGVPVGPGIWALDVQQENMNFQWM